MTSHQSHSCVRDAAPRGRYAATVELNRPVCREHHLLRLRVAPGPAQPAFPPTQPGQFIQLGCRPPNGSLPAEALQGGEVEWRPDCPPAIGQPEIRGPLALLRRPFSLSGRGDDAGGTWLEIIHRVVGVGTAWLAGLRPGDPVDLIGPLGNAFTLPPGKSSGLLVGGGVGLPPMFYLAAALMRHAWIGEAFVGATTRDLLALRLVGEPARDGALSMCADEFNRYDVGCRITTDDGSAGMRGLVTAALATRLERMATSDLKQAVVYTCGPNPMMRAVAELATKHGVDCQVCLEQAMACGMGTCQSCVVRIRDAARPQGHTPDGRPWRYRLACTDGPVFAAADVVW